MSRFKSYLKEQMTLTEQILTEVNLAVGEFELYLTENTLSDEQKEVAKDIARYFAWQEHSHTLSPNSKLEMTEFAEVETVFQSLLKKANTIKEWAEAIFVPAFEAVRNFMHDAVKEVKTIIQKYSRNNTYSSLLLKYDLTKAKDRRAMWDNIVYSTDS